MLRNTNAEMVLPMNAVKMTEDEMMYVEGGAAVAALGVYGAICGGAYYMGHIMSSSYTTTARRGGRTYTVSYNPGKNCASVGNTLKALGKTGGTKCVDLAVGYLIGKY